MQHPVSEPWWEVVCEIPVEHAQDVAALLAESGALAVEVIETHDPALPPLPFAKPQPSHPSMALVVAGFAHAEGQDEALATTQQALDDMGLAPSKPLHVSLRNDADWAWKWKEFFAPLQTGQHLWIVPTWDTSFTPPHGSTVLRLDPGMAFGTGQHETTALCLQAIESYVSQNPSLVASPSFRAADIGTGTGVLAIALAALGCNHVLATDNDPLAVEATHANALQNNVQQSVHASDIDVANIQETFPFVVANILAHTLIELADPMLRLLSASPSCMLLSGILAEQAQDVVHAYTTHAHALGITSFQLHHTWKQGTWVALEFRS